MFRSMTSSAAALILAAAPVFADVTPAEVWESLQGYYSGMGYQVTTDSRDEAGSVLTLSGVTLASPGEGAATMTVSIPKITLQQTGDAKVRTVIDGEVIADGTATSEDGEEAAFDMRLTMPGNEILSSGSAADMLHEVNYPQLVAAIRIGDQQGDTDKAPITLSINDLGGSYRVKQGDGQEWTYDTTAASADLKVALTPPPAEDGGAAEDHVSADLRMEGLAATGSAKMPRDQVNLAERLDLALRAGMAMDGKVSTGPITGAVAFSGTDSEGQQQTGNATFSSEGGEITLGMSEAGLSYHGAAKAMKVEMTTNSLPFPISYAIDSASGGLDFPVTASENPQPFKLRYALAGLVLADDIWNLFDPTSQLPRDPASLTLDLQGQTLVKQDLLDPAFSQQMEDMAQQQADPAAEGTDMPVPFQPLSVKVNKLAFDGIGVTADLSSNDMTLPEGSETPVGTVKGSFTGVNALLDKLVAMGVVPQDQVMGARMMIAMFARPAEGNPDELQTELEFRKDGSVFANGQQVK